MKQESLEKDKQDLLRELLAEIKQLEEELLEAAHEEQSSSKRARKDKSTKKHHKHRE